MSEYHESWDALPEDAKRFHRALTSLQEEIEAVDWYHQRLSVTADRSLADLLAHNRDEEMEHAAMLLEWLRRHMPGWDAQLREYLFSEGPLTGIEEAATGGAATGGAAAGGSARGGSARGGTAAGGATPEGPGAGPGLSSGLSPGVGPGVGLGIGDPKGRAR